MNFQLKIKKISVKTQGRRKGSCSASEAAVLMEEKRIFPPWAQSLW
jgi:hypothetical protein